MNRFLHRIFCLALLVAAGVLAAPLVARANLSSDFHGVQQNLNDHLHEIYSGENDTNLSAQISSNMGVLKSYVEGYSAQDVAAILNAPLPSQLSGAGQIGVARARLQHVAALAMLQCQKSGNFSGAQQWRALITLPQFASGVDSAMLLQNPQMAQKPEVAAALAREYLEWQTMRVRQLLDFLQQQVAIKAADKNVVEANENEILTLANFPTQLVQIAGLTNTITPVTAEIAWNDTDDEKQKVDAVTAWRDEVESGLPNLLSPSDIGRMQRMLARCVKLVPREYSHGVSDGKLIIPLELREAKQFTDQSQTLVNQLAPVWKQEQPAAYVKYRPELAVQLTDLQTLLNNLAPQDDLDNQSKKISTILEDQFKIAARRPGDSGDVIDETVLEVRSTLGGSLAAAQNDQWDSAESQRMDAYTAFDTEIEARVLPRRSGFGVESGKPVSWRERWFATGHQGVAGTVMRRWTNSKRRTKRTLGELAQCTELLKVAVAPTTIGFTAFTIVAREGLEAIIILAALFAGLRGADYCQHTQGHSPVAHGWGLLTHSDHFLALAHSHSFANTLW